MPRPHFLAPLRTVALMLLLCVFAVRVIVPQGYMWASDAHGAPVMIVCPGVTPMHRMPGMAAGHHGGQQHDHDGKAGDHPCAFAAAGLAVDRVADLHPVAVAPAAADVPVALHIFARPGLGLAAPPPPKTGPPRLA